MAFANMGELCIGLCQKIFLRSSTFRLGDPLMEWQVFFVSI